MKLATFTTKGNENPRYGFKKETDTTIVIEEDGDVGIIEILGVNQDKIDRKSVV